MFAGAGLISLACCLALASSVTSDVRAAPGPRSEEVAIQELLDRRAAAWLARDEDAFMATVSRADPRFRRRQSRSFGWGGGVPLASYRLVARFGLRGDLSSPSVRARYPDAQAVITPLTEERYRLEGFDRDEAVEDMYLTFVREDGRWLIGGDSDLASVGLPSARHMWDFGPIARLASPHFTLWTHPCGSPAGCVAIAPGFLGVMERALGRVDAVWTDRWSRRVPVLVPATPRELERIIQATFDVDNFVAFASTTIDLERGLRFSGDRVLLNWPSIAGRSDAGVVTILSHELLHVATRPVAGPFVPTFVDEGIAEYVGYGDDPGSLAYLDAVVAAGDFDGRLPRDFEFLTGRGSDIYTSYQEAQSAIRYFVERWGRDKLVALYRRLGRPHIAPGTATYHLDSALRATVGMGTARFERAWADSIEP
jgi:hypothetical protein